MIKAAREIDKFFSATDNQGAAIDLCRGADSVCHSRISQKN